MTEPAAGLDATDRTLEEVEARPWGEPPADASYLVARCHALRRLPLDELEIEDLRMLLGQSIGAPTLVPRALRVLSDDPLAEGDFYRGDLLAAVLRLDDSYWAAHLDQRAALAGIVDRVDLGDDHGTDDDLRQLVTSFLVDPDERGGSLADGSSEVR